MKTRKNMSQQTIENLKEAFWKLYEQKSVARIGIKEITDLAGYNRGTFYLYFKDVYDVLEQVEEEILSDTREHFKFIRESLDSPKTIDLMKCALTISKRHDKHMSILLGEHGDPKFEFMYKEITKEFLMQNFDNDLKSEYSLEFFVSGLIGAVKLWQSRGADLEVEEFSKIIIEFYSNNFD